MVILRIAMLYANRQKFTTPGCCHPESQFLDNVIKGQFAKFNVLLKQISAALVLYLALKRLHIVASTMPKHLVCWWRQMKRRAV